MAGGRIILAQTQTADQDARVSVAKARESIARAARRAILHRGPEVGSPKWRTSISRTVSVRVHRRRLLRRSSDSIRPSSLIRALYRKDYNLKRFARWVEGIVRMR